MGRSPCCSKVGLQRGPWSSEEDTLLRNYIQQHGEGQWRSVPNKAGLPRCGKSCRLRWMNYLRPGIKRGNITADEEDLVIRLHSLLGNRWTLIAGRLPGRTDNEVKNHWNTHMSKKLKNSGIQPKIPKHSTKQPDQEIQNAVEPETDKRSTKCPERETQNAVVPETDKRSTKCPEQETQNAVEPEADKSSKKCPQKKTKSTLPETGVSRRQTKKGTNDDENTKNTQGSETRTLHIPKPIRLSSAFSRGNSLDSLLSAASSGDVSVNAEKFKLWPLVELDHANHGGFNQVFDGYEDFFSTYDFPLHYSASSSSVKMLEKVYDEYLQLL